MTSRRNNTSKTVYAEVAPAMPLPPAKSQTFTYQLSAKDTAKPGSLVTVPVGRRFISGVVISTHHQKPAYRTKPVKEIFPIQFTPGQLEFARWIATAMQGGLGFTLRLFAPPTGQTINTPPATTQPTITTGLTAAAIDTFPKRWKSISRYIKTYRHHEKQVLVVVPETWMAHKIAAAIPGAVAYHAGLTPNERGDIWRDVYTGTQHIVVGTQKALFLPWQNLGLIVLEEEQLPSHKLWDQYPRLDNRIAVRQLQAIHSAALLYTSSFPSVALWHATKEHAAIILQNNPVNIKTKLIAMSFQDRKEKRPLPDDFLYHMRKWTRDGDRIFVLYNKLGKHGLTQARHLFHKSPTLHAQLDKRIVIGTSGLLTQVDHQQFDRVVWLFPEIAMRFPDYRSEEQALIMLARLQTRSKSRRAITIVTKYPPIIEQKLIPDWQDTYTALLKERKSLKYPPFTDLIKITSLYKTQAGADKRAEQLRQHIEKQLPQGSPTQVRGPYHPLRQSPRTKKYESHILLQGPLEKLIPLYQNFPVDVVDIMPQQVL